jgi:hypothetical protein
MENEKYILKQDFVQKFKINNMDYIFDTFKKGYIVEGDIVSRGQRLRVGIRLANKPLSVRIPMSMLKKVIHQSSEKRSSVDGTETGVSENNNTSIFTMKNIVMGLVGIAVVYGILKLTKTIK